MAIERSLSHYLESRLLEWIQEKNLDLKSDSWIKPCQDERFGHFQTNLALICAKTLKTSPRHIAQELVACYEKDSYLDPPQIAGPGFVNFTFNQKGLETAFSQLLQDPHLGIPQAISPQNILFDFSGPNVAKEMHIGHIRSTILGDTISKIASSLGHQTIKDNHLGDWGTQFGKMILGYKKAGCPTLDPETAISEMEKFYQVIHQSCEQDPDLLDQARQELHLLQSGDEENLKIWETFRSLSQSAFDAIYQRLDIKFDHTLAESFYNPWLKEIVNELKEKNIARESDGATVVFFDEKDLKDNPFLIEKSDGAALYATTDLATLQYRIREFKTDSIVYVTDGRQQLHFKQLFATAKKWGIETHLHHVWFGTILGENKTPLKTREGTPIKLKDLLDEAEKRARKILLEKRPDFPPEKLEKMSQVIGIGSLKYADLAQNRNLDYVFEWDRLLSFDGNTAPYLINAYVRTRSILRKAGQIQSNSSPILEEDLDRDLSRKLLMFGEVLETSFAEFRPHHLCGYLHECAALFHRFFEHCPVLKAPSEEIKNSRLLLCQQTGKILQKGLHLLGIETVEEM